MSSPSPNSYLVQQPQQARSRDTMSQILEAATQILDNKTFEELTVVEVVQNAGCSVGAFYGRFKDKDALLEALDERFFLEFERDVREFLTPSNWVDKSFTEIIERVTVLLIEIYSKQKGVLRSLNLKARLHGDIRFRKREKEAWDELFPQLQQILLLHQSEITHPDPILATHLGFQQLFFTMREVLLWEPLRQDAPYDRETLIHELSRAYVAYLGVLEGRA